MSQSILSAPHFHNEEAAFAYVEAMLEAGQIETGHTLIGCYWLLRHRDQLRREWLGH